MDLRENATYLETDTVGLCTFFQMYQNLNTGTVEQGGGAVFANNAKY